MNSSSLIWSASAKFRAWHCHQDLRCFIHSRHKSNEGELSNVNLADELRSSKSPRRSKKGFTLVQSFYSSLKSVPLRFGDCFSRYFVKKDARQREKAL